MSKLLISEQPLQILPSLAAAIGLNEAIFLQQLHYWLKKSKHEHDGKVWIYNTYEEWHEQLPFWSLRTMQRIVKSLLDKELINVHQFGAADWDRKNWYAIDYDRLAEIERQIDVSECAKLARSVRTKRRLLDSVKLSPSLTEITQETTTEITTEKKIGEAEPSHPTGIALLRDVQGMYPPKERNSAYLEILGDDPDEELLRECRAEWLDRGYNKMSWKWFTDWYAKGGIQNGNGRQSAEVKWQIVAGEKIKVLPPGTVLPNGAVIAEDRGEIYYVVACNGDGVSPRFRTAEAFAESRGLTMDQVLKPGQTWPRPKILWS